MSGLSVGGLGEERPAPASRTCHLAWPVSLYVQQPSMYRYKSADIKSLLYTSVRPS